MQSFYPWNKCSYLCSTIVSNIRFPKLRGTVRKGAIKIYHRDKKTMSVGASCNQGNSYEDAVNALNQLQSNASTIQRIKKETPAEREKALENSLPNMKLYLQRIGIAVEDLDALNIIHIGGTNGKGSVAAFTESILRNNGFKTGFFSSPHLVEVRERIRLNGEPLEKQKFAKYFFECYEKLASNEGKDMPPFFRFLTLMSFHVYLKEKVDVVVLEVGIGGTYDSTNIIRNPVISGITLLEYDHVSMLGNTIESIAWNKAGIIKSGRPALSIPQIYKSGEKVLFQQAKERKASSFQLVPEFSEYGNTCLKLGLPGKHQQINASLALQLCRLWMRDKRDKYLDKIKNLPDDVHSLLDQPITGDTEYINPFSIPDTFKKGIEEAHWPGRCHIVRGEKETFYLDGAHTIGSMKAFVEWLEEELPKDTRNFKRDDVYRILVFYLSRGDGKRDYAGLLKELVKLDFDFAIFSNIIDGRSSTTSTGLKTDDEPLTKSRQSQKTWLMLSNKIDELNNLNEKIGDRNRIQKTASSSVFPSVLSSIDWIQNKDKSDLYLPPEKLQHASHVQIIVTGSFHSVGAVFKYLNCSVYETEP